MILPTDRSRFHFTGVIGLLECNQESDADVAEFVYNHLSSCSVFLEKPTFLSLLGSNQIALVFTICDAGTALMILVSHVEEGDYENLSMGVCRELNSTQEPLVAQAIGMSLACLRGKKTGRILQWFVPEAYWHFLDYALPQTSMKEVGVFSELKAAVDELHIQGRNEHHCRELKEIQFVNEAELFALYEQTCKDSQDCPEGSKLRNPQSTFQGLIRDPSLEKSLSALYLQGERSVAVLLGSLEGDSARVLYVGVVPGCRKHGLAKNMLAWMIGRLAERKIRYLEVLVDEGNLPAWRLYMGIGMRVLHRWRLLMGR